MAIAEKEEKNQDVKSKQPLSELLTFILQRLQVLEERVNAIES